MTPDKYIKGPAGKKALRNVNNTCRMPQKSKPMTDKEQLKAFEDAVEKIAFQMPAPNEFTPQLIHLVVHSRHVRLERECREDATKGEGDA